MGHAPRRFDPSLAARLDDPRRAELMPHGPLVAALGLRPGERVADVGCGTGYWLVALLDTAPEGTRFQAVDVEPAMLTRLEERLRDHPRRADVAAVRSSEDRVPLPDGSLDAIVMGAVYHELPGRPAWLGEIRRLLAPGGRVAIVDWEVLPEGVERTMGPPVEERVPVATARAELEAAGFVAVEAVNGYRESWCLLARR